MTQRGNANTRKSLNRAQNFFIKEKKTNLYKLEKSTLVGFFACCLVGCETSLYVEQEQFSPHNSLLVFTISVELYGISNNAVVFARKCSIRAFSLKQWLLILYYPPREVQNSLLSAQAKLQTRAGSQLLAIACSIFLCFRNPCSVW